ncbi:MAG: serine hydrolase domain-containing protein [Candidatus Cryptobacteroides sp.]
MKKRKNRYLIPLTLLCLVAVTVVIVSAASKHRSEEDMEEYRPLVRLNDTLVNSLCELDTLKGLDKAVRSYMAKWDLKGLSLAIMRNDSLLFAKGYGWADKEAGVEMQPGNILRMASVSKLITATGIMVLQERGLISLKDTVFGPRGVLCDSVFTASVKDKRMFNITIEDLLRHKGGFTCGRGDPMFSTRDIIRQFRLDGAPDHETLVRCILTRPLGFAPGTSQSYSNFGYLLLSMAIEKITGTDYETFIRENVLEPAGCFDMHIANNYYEERYDNEVKYYMQKDSEPCEEYTLSGNMVPRCYGGSDINSLSGAGAWCGSPAELCRFVASIDGKDGVPDIISQESVAAMTEYFDQDTYSLGWNDTKPDGEWTRTGTLAGTSALIKCYPDGECWIMITNTGTYVGPHLSRHTSELFRKCRQSYSGRLPSQNLFGS